ncbi:MAG: hypothetical protein H6719_16590 [Sandaracinaceae bacterium]|nr:hypothetical protein [Sandaracinaceae bacterium]
MGAVGTSITIEPASRPRGKPRSTSLALHQAITRSTKGWLARRGWGATFAPIAVSYLGDEVADGYRGRRFFASDTELTWTFGDKAGLCGGSSHACLHWWELALSERRGAYDELAAARGWRLTTPSRSTHVTRLRTTYPLRGLAKTYPMCVPPFRFGALDWAAASGPFFDEGSPRPALGDLSRSERSLFVRAAIVGACGCPLCAIVPFERMRTPGPLLEKSWLRMGEDEPLRALCERVVDELPVDWIPNVAPGALGELMSALRTTKITIQDAAGLAFRAVEAMRRGG